MTHDFADGFYRNPLRQTDDTSEGMAGKVEIEKQNEHWKRKESIT